MVNFDSMTKTDTVTGRMAELRVACPLDGGGIAAAIAAADHAQKKLVSAPDQKLIPPCVLSQSGTFRTSGPWKFWF